MAKRKKPGGKAQSDKPSKGRLELRFSDELLTRIKETADKAGISVNQFMQGVSQWAVQNAVVGEPYRDEFGLVAKRDVQGVVFFGSVGSQVTASDRQMYAAQTGEDPSDLNNDKGNVIFSIDFTERRVVRDEEI